MRNCLCSSSFLFPYRYLLLYDNNNFNNNITIMSLFIKLFNTTAEYNAYTADTENFILPNVSCAMDDLTNVHYNPWVETRVVAKFNVTDTSNPTRIASGTSDFTAIEIDGVEQPSAVSAYTFTTTGEHTVKYTLTDPTIIGSSVFYYCSSLTSIDIPNSVTTIGSSAFTYCTSLTSIEIPSGVTSIGQYAFYRCTGLTSCTIGSGVTSIGESAFQGCSGLTSINIPNSVTSIVGYAFAYCRSLTSCTIGNGVTSIGTGTFQDCSSLTSCTIGSGVTSIGSMTFYNCSSLTSATVNATTPPTLSANAFYNTNNCPIYVPSASVETYKSASGWSGYASRIQPIT